MANVRPGWAHRARHPPGPSPPADWRDGHRTSDCGAGASFVKVPNDLRLAMDTDGGAATRGVGLLAAEESAREEVAGPEEQQDEPDDFDHDRHRD